jgi:hypothetical protein
VLHDSNLDSRWYGEINVGGSSWAVRGGSNVADGQWHHLVFQRIGSTLKSYQDGKLANTLSGASASNLTTGQSMFFGNTQDGDNGYDGQLDDVMLFNYALTDHQVRVLFNQNAAVRFGPATGSP